ncbi:MAG: nicotinate (nicotinamide) nucleotide adenylyltransferase [Dehalococcoidia bacterium]|nr:nicotinate (nicotinamide) nucleotide adenylyltransferase [Dehalococcoidia bacterium]
MGGVNVRTGILGGTFDPPHLGHLVLAAAARHTLELDRVLFIPAGDPWRKAGRRVTPAEDRLDMTRALVEGVEWAVVSDIEVRREGPSYTTETLEQLARDGGDWWFILGADALADLPHWSHPERIISAVRLAVARRPDETDGVITPALQAALPGIEARVDLVPMPRLDISSSDLRERVRDGRPTQFLLQDAVRAVIDRRGIYFDGDEDPGAPPL